MRKIKYKVRKRLAIDFIKNYDLLVIPTFPFIKRLKVGNLKIVSNKRIKIDYVYIKIPYNKDINSKKLVLDCYRRLLDIIRVNEYKNILIDNMNMSLISECCNYNNKDICHDIYKLINDYIKDIDINVGIVISNIKDKKYYFD